MEGAAGNAWQIGIIAGLAEAGVDMTEVADLVIGTSAGATAAAQVRSGIRAAELLASILSQPVPPVGQTRQAPPSTPVAAVYERMRAIGATATSAVDLCRAMGAFGLESDAAFGPAAADQRRAMVASRLPRPAWPRRPMIVVATRYINGGVRSTENADLSVDTRDRPQRSDLGGYSKNVVSVHDGNGVQFYDANQGLNVGNVTALHESDSRMWAGGEHGVNVFENGHFIITTFAGQPTIEGITGIVFANDRSLWLNARSGIFRVSNEEVAAFLTDHHHAMSVDAFNYLDGLPGDGGVLYPLPTAVKGTDGRLWFSTNGGLVFVDPAHIHKNGIVPPVAIRSVRADGRSIEADVGAQLPKGTRSLEIDYTALSLSIPDRVHFKYKLEGFDTDWQDVGSRRQAFYTSIPPKNYVFRVIGCNNDGLWNTTGIAIPINLPATFLQGWYFKILCVALGAIALWWFYQLRIAQVEVGIRAGLYERLGERERIARDLHDTFFQGIQGLLLSFNLGTSRMVKGDPVRTLFEENLALSDQVMLEGRKLVLDLRTRISEATEIESDFSVVASELAKLYPTQFALTVTGSPRRLDAVVSEEIYKIGREALYNAFRHASATKIEVEVTYASNEMRLNFRDDGRGIPEPVLQNGSSDGHFGLPGMAERAEKIGGRFSIFSRTGGGTEIEVKISSRLAYRSGPTRKHRNPPG